MTELTTPVYEDDEISLLDILVILAESWKLLVFGPLIAGVLAGGLSFLWPKTFESVAIVRMTEEEVALLHTPPVLDSLIEKFGLLDKADGIVDDARQEVRARLTFAVDKKTKLATITAKASTPDEAKTLCNSAIAALLKEFQTKGRGGVLIEKIIIINSRAIAIAEDAVESIQRSLKRVGAAGYKVQTSVNDNLAAINEDIAKLSQENEQLRNKVEPKSEELLVQEASLPQRKASPKRGLVVLMAIMVSSLVLFGFVLVRKFVTLAAQDPITSAKLDAICASLGLRPVKNKCER
jgi:capsular polysaccharide biosynthesis protein